MRKYIIGLVGVSLVLAAVLSPVFAVSRRTAAAAGSDVRSLLRMMDKDQNGTVSKEEFMSFMSDTFDRLDINANRELEVSELRPLTNPNWNRCNALAIERGQLENERRSINGAPSPWKNFMDACLAGRVR